MTRFVNEDGDAENRSLQGGRPMIALGTFQSSFATHAAALAAARDSRTRGFNVEVSGPLAGRWRHESRCRATVPVSELTRYESRLRTVASSFDGRYEGFTADPAPDHGEQEAEIKLLKRVPNGPLSDRSRATDQDTLAELG